MKTKSLYMLTDPTGAPICYIGSTNAPRRRYAEHYGNRKNSPVLSNWISSLKEQGLSPIMNILVAEIPESEIAQAEMDAVNMNKAIRGEFCLNGSQKIFMPVIATLN